MTTITKIKTDLQQMIISNRTFQLVFVIVISAVVIFHRLGEAPLAGDDCYYSQQAKEMAQTGDYLTLRYGYNIDHGNKPPFIFWMNSLSGKIFGFNNFSMRLGSAVLGFIGIIATLFFVSKFFNPYTGFISALVLTFTQQYLYHARSAVTDCPLAVFFALALYSFWIVHFKSKPVFYYLMGFFVGLAVMTRQVSGLLIYLVIAVYILLTKNYKILLDLNFYGGILLSMIIFLPWHIWSIITHGSRFIESYLGAVFKFVISGDGSYVEPWYEHIKKIVENYWPWLPFLIASIYKTSKDILIKKLTIEELNKRVFLMCWWIAPFIIFQLSKEKHTNFLTPLYFPFAILVGLTFDRFRDTLKIKITSFFLIIFSVAAIVFVSYPLIPKTMDSTEYVHYMPLIPEIKKLDKDLYTLHKNFWYFSNATWFYADKRTIALTEEELERKLYSPEISYFVLFQDDFYSFLRKHQTKIKILKATKRIVLFSNNRSLLKSSKALSEMKYAFTSRENLINEKEGNCS